MWTVRNELEPRWNYIEAYDNHWIKNKMPKSFESDDTHFSIYSGLLVAMLPLIIALVGYVMYKQYEDRQQSFKNYRHIMHTSLLCQTIAYSLRCLDMASISYDKEIHISALQIKEDSYCSMSGSIQILFETFGYILLASYLFLLRSSVTNATADLGCLRIKLLCIAISLTLVAWLGILKGPKIGLESTLSCGVEYSSSFTEYTEILRQWQILLVPYLFWKSINLTKSVPGFIKSSFSYYALQVIFYVTFFAIRMTLCFILAVISIGTLQANDGYPSSKNETIKNLSLLLYSLEVLDLTYLVSMD